MPIYSEKVMEHFMNPAMWGRSRMLTASVRWETLFAGT